jgi:putative (di)nucleoside polyphosphate hydrolase
MTATGEELGMELGYRPAVGILLLNSENEVFVGQRLDSTLEAWQMPQGGIDAGEDPVEAAYRELREETGIERQLAEILAQSSRRLTYDLPHDLVGKLWGGRYRGQEQYWFAMRFTGSERDINLATDEPEFRAYRWVEPRLLPELIVPFKRRLYQEVLAEFSPLLG